MARLLRETGLVKRTLAGVTSLGAVTVGVDDTGHDVKFFGATSTKYFLYDESADEVQVVGKVRVLKGSPFQTSFVSSWVLGG